MEYHRGESYADEISGRKYSGMEDSEVFFLGMSYPEYYKCMIWVLLRVENYNVECLSRNLNLTVISKSEHCETSFLEIGQLKKTAVIKLSLSVHSSYLLIYIENFYKNLLPDSR